MDESKLLCILHTINAILYAQGMGMQLHKHSITDHLPILTPQGSLLVPTLYNLLLNRFSSLGKMSDEFPEARNRASLLITCRNSLCIQHLNYSVYLH